MRNVCNIILYTKKFMEICNDIYLLVDDFLIFQIIYFKSFLKKSCPRFIDLWSLQFQSQQMGNFIIFHFMSVFRPIIMCLQPNLFRQNNYTADLILELDLYRYYYIIYVILSL